MNAAIRLENLHVTLGDKPLIHGVSASFELGQVIGLIGPNGAGKTTLLKSMLRLLPLSSGKIFLCGEEVSARAPHQLQDVVSYLPQGQTAYWPLSIYDLVALGRPDGDKAAIEHAIAAVGLDGFQRRPISELSGGERARALLARVLASDAPLIFADEPVASLDPHHQLAVMDIFRKAAQRGRTIITVLHDLNLAERYCDTLALLHEGRLVACGDPSSVLQGPILSDVYKVQVDHDFRALSFRI